MCAPDMMVPVPRGAPEPTETSLLHHAKRVLVEHFYVPIRRRQIDLFPQPERGSGLDVEIHVPGLSPMPGRLQSIDLSRSDDVTLQTQLQGRGPRLDSDHGKPGDYVRITPEGPESNVILVEHIPVETVEVPASSQRIAFLSVRPDWTDNRALLGYYNPLTQQYQSTELLELMLRARANADEPHLVVLDEMNLAKVEYYFSDFLSAMEAESDLTLHDAGEDLTSGEQGTVPIPPRLRVPSNVFFTGTVNVDETTYMFSPKVLDRANTLEFNDVDLVGYGSSLSTEPGVFRLRPGVQVEDLLKAYRKPVPQDWRALPIEYADRLRALHSLMAEYNLHFGYRVANEIARYMNLAAEFVGPDALEIAYDLQVLQKVLPKLSGSRAQPRAAAPGPARPPQQGGSAALVCQGRADAWDRPVSRLRELRGVIRFRTGVGFADEVPVDAGGRTVLSCWQEYLAESEEAQSLPKSCVSRELPSDDDGWRALVNFGDYVGLLSLGDQLCEIRSRKLDSARASTRCSKRSPLGSRTCRSTSTRPRSYPSPARRWASGTGSTRPSSTSAGRCSGQRRRSPSRGRRSARTRTGRLIREERREAPWDARGVRPRTLEQIARHPENWVPLEADSPLANTALAHALAHDGGRGTSPARSSRSLPSQRSTPPRTAS